MRGRRTLAAACTLLAATLLAGCISIPDLITRPRNLSPIDAELRREMEQALELPRQTFHAPDGTSISWLRVDPADRGLEYEVHRTPDSMRFEMRTTRAVPGSVHARGSVVWLHGWGMDGSSTMPWALGLGELGYMGVVVDLRGHGFSAPAPIGYGVVEAHDVATLVRHLLDADSLPRPVFLAGISYGASTALLAEPDLHADIAGIITLAPFANAGDSIRFLLGKAAEPDQTGFARRIRSRWLRRQIEGDRLDAAMAEAGSRLGIDLDAIRIGPTVAASRTCIVQLHGVDDQVIPIDAARALAAEGPRVQLHELPHDNHLTLPMRVDWLAGPLASWMEEVAGNADGDCPPLQLPADPLAGTATAR